MDKESIINEDWQFVSDKDSGTDYFVKEYKDSFGGYVDVILVLSKPIDSNFKENSIIRIDKYSLGALHSYPIYMGMCPSIEEFQHICKLLKITNE